MRRKQVGRSTDVVTGLAAGWLLNMFVIAPVSGFGPPELQENIGGVSWILVLLLPPLLGVAVLYWLLEPLVDAVRARFAWRRDA